MIRIGSARTNDTFRRDPIARLTPTERPERLCELARAAGIPVGLEAARSLVAYLDAMLAENATINLTGVRDPEHALVLHALDSLVVARLRSAPATALDLGSGNGFPGVALRVLYPDVRLVLVDRTLKKLAAIRRALDAAGLTGVETRHADAAQLPGLEPELRHAFDLVTARAVGAPEEVAPLAAPLVARPGRVAMWLSESTPSPRSLAGGLELERVEEYELPEPAARRRRLAVYARAAARRDRA